MLLFKLAGHCCTFINNDHRSEHWNAYIQWCVKAYIRTHILPLCFRVFILLFYHNFFMNACLLLTYCLRCGQSLLCCISVIFFYFLMYILNSNCLCDWRSFWFTKWALHILLLLFLVMSNNMYLCFLSFSRTLFIQQPLKPHAYMPQ